MRTMVTGSAGFIGYHVAERLLARGEEVLGVDVVNDYYDVGLKEARLSRLAAHAGYRHLRLDLADAAAVAALFERERPARVIHLAAQAGVRYALSHPESYLQSNLSAFLHVLEGCARHGAAHLTYASSSSVYGANGAVPWTETQGVAHPLNLYAASKIANEAMAHAYAHLYELPTTGLRFFTVYGPWGRPDMAIFTFCRRILAGEPIDVYNHGEMARDFTYVDDVAAAVVATHDTPARPNPDWHADAPDPASSRAPWRIYNVGNGESVALGRMIDLLEQILERPALRRYLPLQIGDALVTSADSSALARATGCAPHTPLEEGLRRFVAWYRGYYRV